MQKLKFYHSYICCCYLSNFHQISTSFIHTCQYLWNIKSKSGRLAKVCANHWFQATLLMIVFCQRGNHNQKHLRGNSKFQHKDDISILQKQITFSKQGINYLPFMTHWIRIGSIWAISSSIYYLEGQIWAGSKQL